MLIKDNRQDDPSLSVGRLSTNTAPPHLESVLFEPGHLDEADMPEGEPAGELPEDEPAGELPEGVSAGVLPEGEHGHFDEHNSPGQVLSDTPAVQSR